MRKILAVILMVFLFAAPSWAAGAGTNVSTAKGADTESGQVIAYLTLAEQLTELGREQKAPVILASAAQLLSEAGTPTEIKREKTEEELPASERQAHSSEKTPASEEATAESLYAEAIALAKSQGDTVLAEILEKQSRTGGTKGASGGAIRHYDRVQAYSNDVYNIQFRGGQTAWLRVRGDGDPTAVYIYDENGNFITSDTDWHTQSTVSWTPRWTGNFKVVVKNRVGVYVNYALVTN